MVYLRGDTFDFESRYPLDDAPRLMIEATDGSAYIVPERSRLSVLRGLDGSKIEAVARPADFMRARDAYVPRVCRISRKYEFCARNARSPSSVTSDCGGVPPSVCA